MSNLSQKFNQARETTESSIRQRYKNIDDAKFSNASVYATISFPLVVPTYTSSINSFY